MKKIISDTGPILHLCEADLLHLLHKCGTVAITYEINLEVEKHYHQWKKIRPKWITVMPLLPSEIVEVKLFQRTGLVDVGEVGAIILSKRLKPDWFLTDDALARILAESFGLEVHGSLGIVLWNAATGKLDHDQSVSTLNKLAHTSLWISNNILKEANNAIEKMFRK